MRKLISALVSVLLVALLVPAEAFAQVGDELDDALTQLPVSLRESFGGFASGSADLSVRALKAQSGDSVRASVRDPQRVGIGGGGALFDPAVSPFNANEMAVGTDMGDFYVTCDGGTSWSKKAVGRVYDIQYDPTRQGTMYACGSGIWRSTDHGENFELM